MATLIAKVDVHAYIVCPCCDGQIDCIHSSDWDRLMPVLTCPDCAKKMKRPPNPFKLKRSGVVVDKLEEYYDPAL